jgi:type II secretory pathway pseudopilin PulG
MRNNSSSKSSSATRGRGGLLRMLGDTQAGFTIIEVVVASVMLTLMAGAVATALISTATVSGDQRRRSQADSIAQQEQERLKGLPIKTLNGLSTTNFVTDDGSNWTSSSPGTKFTVTSTGKFLSNQGASSCASSDTGGAAYVMIHTEVTWAGNNRPPVTEDSLIAPRVGGTLIADVIDQDSQPLAGANVQVLGSKDSDNETTNSEGCAIFTSLQSPGYYVLVTKSGFVTTGGTDTAGGGASIATGTSFPSPNPAQIGQAGAIQASFAATGASGAVAGQAPSLSVSNPGRNAGAPFVTTPATVPASQITTTQTLFPFNSPVGTHFSYTNNYAAWAGKCAAQQPPTGANHSDFTVGPGVTATSPAVKEPALDLRVTYNGVRQKPSYVRLDYTQSAPTACSESWQPSIASDGASNANGSLASPGQPYAGSYTVSTTTYTGTYSICAGYNPGSGGTRYGTLTAQTLTNFATATQKTIPLVTASPTTQC